MGFLDFLNPRKTAEEALMQNLERLCNLVKMGLYSRLLARCSQRYDRGFAAFVAAAVANASFSEPPGIEEGRRFLRQHGQLIEQELAELRKDQQTCNVLTQILRARSVIPFAKGETADTWMRPLDKLERYGILAPGGPA